MRRHALILVAAVVAGCNAVESSRLPPPDRFYFPTGIAHAVAPGSTEGTLYVASANFDKCYDYGQVSAVNLDVVSPRLPLLGGAYERDGAGKVLVDEITELPVGKDERRLIQSFAGELAAWPKPDGSGMRLFIPSRAEGSPLHVVDTGADGTSLACYGDVASDSCIFAAPSLDVAPERGNDGLPSAPAPVGVAVGTVGHGANRVFVTHMQPATALSDTSTTPVGYNFVLELDAANPGVTKESYIPTLQYSGAATIMTQSVAVGRRYAYLTSRSAGEVYPLIQFVDLDPDRRLETVGEGDAAQQYVRVRGYAIGTTYRATDARGIAISADEKRLYVALRGASNADKLLVADIIGPDSDTPSLRVVRVVPLAPGADQVRVIDRPNGNLVLVTSAGETTDPKGLGALTVYDDGIGEVVAGLFRLGKQPYGVAVNVREDGVVKRARIYVSLFGEGRVAVVDMPDVTKPEDTFPVAYLGAKQIDSNSAGRQSAICGVGE
ncbi:MAG: hypothetical protein L0Y66_24770 [Myxococcaceae bacterium]|nr:hypothetical protein [Myxococcaceae bacterium]